ncbi:MAG: hypothetical protein EOP52_04530 [Sphingobacteriales bacterium]|nr:MAG: hypothetical protein EOP52_04530 [Sphingobacteriales bacterium]
MHLNKIATAHSGTSFTAYTVMRNIRLLLAAFVFLMASCARPVALQYKGVDRVFLGSVNAKGLQLGVDLKLYNPNSFPMMLKNADLQAFINNRPAGTANLLSSQEVPALDTFILPVTISLDASNLLGNAVDLLTQKEVLVKMEGTVRAGRGGITVPLQVRYEGKQKVKF